MPVARIEVWTAQTPRREPQSRCRRTCSARALELLDISVAVIKRWDGSGANTTPPRAELERAYYPDADQRR
jgi:hypothetical protein